MKEGFRIIEDLCEGLNNWMDEKGIAVSMISLVNHSKHSRTGRTWTSITTMLPG
jgi:hypothetical protein